MALSPAGSLAIAADGDLLRVQGGPALCPLVEVIGVAAREDAIWIVDRRGALHRFDAAGARLGETVELGELGGDVRIDLTDEGAPMALVQGERAVWVRGDRGELQVEPLDRAEDRRILVEGRGLIEHQGLGLVFRSRGTPSRLELPPDLARGRVVLGAAFVDGAALVTEIVVRDQHHLVIHELRGGSIRTRVRLGSATVMAVARRASIAVLGGGAQLALFDLRAGRVVCERTFAAPIRQVAIDAHATRLLVVDDAQAVRELAAGLRDADGAGEVVAIGEPEPEAAEPEAVEPEPGPEAEPEEHGPAAEACAARYAAPSAPVPTPASEPPADIAAALIVEPLLALAPRTRRAPLPRAVLAAYLDDTFALLDTWCDSARASSGGPAGDGDDALARARAAEAEAHDRYTRWNGAGAPLHDLAEELELSPLSRHILLIAAGPALFGELRAKYAALSDASRPLVDELLIGRLLEADRAGQLDLAAELDEAAPLRRHGLVEVVGHRPVASIEVPNSVVRRLAGDPSLEEGLGCVRRRVADRTLDQIRCSRPALQQLLTELARPAAEVPVRVVLAGAAGSGRRTVAAALAEAAGRSLGLVDLAATSEGGADDQLSRALREVHVRGWIACVSGCEAIASGDHELRRRIRAVLDAHPGPLFLRAPLATPPPLAPGYTSFELDSLDLGMREASWRAALARHDLPATAAVSLAARYKVGPGVAERVAGRAARGGAAAGDAATIVEATLRQERAERISAIATRVERLARWEDLVLPDDMAASLRELVGRVRLRGRVLDDWGMARIASTARAVTAMFQGVPGTGKTLAAGVIARELGYDLYRVDLSRVLSKWVGDTEKHLGEVFDAAEGGECVLLFDEADALFGKRTEVKSSHDRYANVEINYLLQRLDSYEGIAILTTNFGTAIDPAFKRRLSLHLQFPFPDEDQRERLWRAHLPPGLPVEGDLELRELARRYQLSGGYIRNAALRAAFLAAADGRPVDAARLRWAVQAEFRDRGTVSSSGILE